MNRLQAARAAMVALSAIGMIWASTPALAANYEATASTVHAKKNPNEPTTTPNVPGNGTVLQAKPADLDVTYLSLRFNLDDRSRGVFGAGTVASSYD